MKDESGYNANPVPGKTRRRRLLRNGGIGAGLAISYQVAGIIIWGTLKDTVVYDFLDRVYWLTNAPCIKLINKLVSVGLLSKHDSVAFVGVLCIYSGVLGFMLGIGISHVIRATKFTERRSYRT